MAINTTSDHTFYLKVQHRTDALDNERMWATSAPTALLRIDSDDACTEVEHT